MSDDLDIPYPCYCGGCISCLREQGWTFCTHCGHEVEPELLKQHEEECYENPYS